MITSIPKVQGTDTVREVQQLLFRNTKQFETINYIYVISKSNVLQGVISIKELLDHNPDTKISEMISGKLIYAHPQTDQEKVARLSLEHNIKAIPIVDEHKHFLGVVPSDVLLDILNHEHHEDLQLLSGIIPHPHNRSKEQPTSVVHHVMYRLPWILFGIAGALLTAQLLGLFEHILTQHVILATFIPLVAYIANAVGTQTQTVFIRDKTIHQDFSVLSYVFKQFCISGLIAIICSLSIFLAILVIWNSAQLALVIALAVFVAVLVATGLALLIPLFLIWQNQDPAVGSGPFATTLQDLLSIVIYFWIAMILL